MDSFWKGAFLQKHVLRVKFIRLVDMEKGDWKILDYGALRPAPKRIIQDMIAKGKLKGFMLVKYDMHKGSHGGKEEYYYPADEEMMQKFEQDELSEDEFHNFGVSSPYRDGKYDNFAEQVEENKTISTQYERLSGVSTLTLAAALAILVARLDEPERSEAHYQSWGQEGEALVVLALIYALNDSDLKDLAKEYGVPTANRSIAAIRNDVIDAVVEAAQDGE
jgi:hypothetical protein